MNGVFPEESLLSPEAFVHEVFTRNETWTWCLFGMFKKHQYYLIDDVLQDFYITVFRKWDLVPKSSHPQMMACLYIMLRHEFYNTLRKERQHTYLDDLPPAEQPLGTLYHLCYNALLDQHSGRLASMLPDEDYQILQLKIQGYKSKEIAERLNVKTSYIDVRLHRVRKKIHPHFS